MQLELQPVHRCASGSLTNGCLPSPLSRLLARLPGVPQAAGEQCGQAHHIAVVSAFSIRHRRQTVMPSSHLFESQRHSPFNPAPQVRHWPQHKPECAAQQGGRSA